MSEPKATPPTVDYRGWSMPLPPGPAWQRLLSLPGQFSLGVLIVAWLGRSVGKSGLFHDLTGIWIDWGHVVRIAWAASVGSTAITLALTCLAYAESDTARVRASIRWNGIGLTLHLLLAGACFGLLHLIRM